MENNSFFNQNTMDVLNILSFVIGLLNLNENLTQGDKQDLMSAFDKQTETVLRDIHERLDSQDERLETIIARLEDLQSNDN